jgi:ankyrin repeat protein
VKSNWFNPIWEAYLSHRDVDALREDVLTTSWYRSPTKTSESLLERAIESCDSRAVQTLIELGESPSLPAEDGFTLLHTAVDMAKQYDESEEAVSIVECLLQNNADPNLHGIDGATPLHRAAGCGLMTVVDLMLRHGGNMEARTLTDGEMTPLMYAALMGQSAMVHFLLGRGADASARCAAYWGDLTAAQLVKRDNPKNAQQTLSILGG